MRRGSYWSEEALAPGVRERIGQLLAGTDDAALPAKAREALKALHAVSDYQGLPRGWPAMWCTTATPRPRI